MGTEASSESRRGPVYTRPETMQEGSGEFFGIFSAVGTGSPQVVAEKRVSDETGPSGRGVNQSQVRRLETNRADSRTWVDPPVRGCPGVSPVSGIAATRQTVARGSRTEGPGNEMRGGTAARHGKVEMPAGVPGPDEECPLKPGFRCHTEWRRIHGRFNSSLKRCHILWGSSGICRRMKANI